MRSLVTILLLALCGGCLGVGSYSSPVEKPDPPATYAAQSPDPALAPLPNSDGQILLHCDRPIDNQQRLLEELALERQYLARRLDLPAPQTPVHVYLYARQATYREHVAAKFPEFPSRRAIFVETSDELAVYAHGGDHLIEDLRHETAHGFLHAAAPGLPLWLDEGLAEFFEVGRSRAGMHRIHIEYLRGQQAVGDWQPNLKRLEQITEASAMTQLDYAEAWLWTHFLLQSPDEKSLVLTAYLADLRSGRATEPLSVRLGRREPDAVIAVTKHLRSLEP